MWTTGSGTVRLRGRRPARCRPSGVRVSRGQRVQRLSCDVSASPGHCVVDGRRAEPVCSGVHGVSPAGVRWASSVAAPLTHAGRRLVNKVLSDEVLRCV